MEAHNNNIEEFLGANKTVFVVPVYQRNYDWKKDNCQQLFDDIVTVIKSGKEHFLGTICFKVYTSRERSIIDGQQRLTSITLLLKAIYDFCSDEEIHKEINDSYFYNEGRGIDSDFLRFKLHLNKRDDAIYHILLDNSKNSIENALNTKQKNSRIYLNYLSFYEMIENYVNKGGNVGDILDALRNLTIIELEIQQENPQEIFESLNSTGLDLTNVDLLRNFFLMQFAHKEQTYLYEMYWSKVEDLIGTDRMEQFFVDFLVFQKRSDAITINGRRNHINERSLYIAFKDYYMGLPFEGNYKKTEHCFAELKACAELYKNFLFMDDVNLTKETKLRKKLYFLLTINDSNKARSLLLYIFDLHNRKMINDDMLNEAVDAISSLTFRARICKAQGINRQFAGSVMQRLDSITDYSRFVDGFWQAITIGKGSYAFPSDAEFINVLMNKDLYQTLHSKGAKYLLYMLESHSPFPKGLPSFDDESITVEHIMPQTLNAQWKKYLTTDTLEDYESLLHRLGNLTLTNYNGEMSNKSFDDKKTIYKDSKFYYTTRLVQYDKWQKNEINDRSQKLANEARNIWKLPAQYQKKKAMPESLHTLGEDTSQFAYTKPAMLMVGNNEYNINNWSEVLPILCEFLAKENVEIFKEVANPEKIYVFKLKDDDFESVKDKVVHIVDDIYVWRFMSASDVLDKAFKIVETYDTLAGTDYVSNILFSLK